MANNTRAVYTLDSYLATQAGEAVADGAMLAGQHMAENSKKKRVIATVLNTLDFYVDKLKAERSKYFSEEIQDSVDFFKQATEFGIQNSLAMKLTYFIGAPFAAIVPMIAIVLGQVILCLTCCWPLRYKPTYGYPPRDGMVNLLFPSHTLLYLIFSSLLLDPRYVRLFLRARALQERWKSAGKATLTCVKREELVKTITAGYDYPTVELDLDAVKQSKVCLVVADWTRRSMKAEAKKLVANRLNKRFTHYVFPQTTDEYCEYHELLTKWKGVSTVRFIRTPDLNPIQIPFTESVIGNFFTGSVPFTWTTPSEINDIPKHFLPQMLAMYLVGKYGSVTGATADILSPDMSGALVVDTLLKSLTAMPLPETEEAEA